MLLLCSARETLSHFLYHNNYQLLTIKSPKFLSSIFPGPLPPVCTICAPLSQGSLHLTALLYLPPGPYSASGQTLSSPTSILLPSFTDPSQENGPDQFWEFRSRRYHRRYTNFKWKVDIGVPKMYLLFPISADNSSLAFSSVGSLVSLIPVPVCLSTLPCCLCTHLPIPTVSSLRAAAIYCALPTLNKAPSLCL